MERDAIKTHVVAILIGGGILLTVLLLAPLPMNQHDEAWIDRLTWFVLHQKNLAQSTAAHSAGPSGTFDPYLGQLILVRSVFRAGDHHATYVAMNRLMDMLETREGGISDEAAEAIWNYCYQVTPSAFHDAARHLKARERAFPKDLEKLGWYRLPPPV